MLDWLSDAFLRGPDISQWVLLLRLFSAFLAGLGVGGLAAFAVRMPPAGAAGLSAEWNLTVRISLGALPANPEPVLNKHVLRHPTGTSPAGKGRRLSHRVRLAPPTSPTTLVTELYQVEGVQQVELVRL